MRHGLLKWMLHFRDLELQVWWLLYDFNWLGQLKLLCPKYVKLLPSFNFNHISEFGYCVAGTLVFQNHWFSGGLSNVSLIFQNVNSDMVYYGFTMVNVALSLETWNLEFLAIDGHDTISSAWSLKLLYCQAAPKAWFQLYLIFWIICLISW